MKYLLFGLYKLFFFANSLGNFLNFLIFFWTCSNHLPVIFQSSSCHFRVILQFKPKTEWGQLKNKILEIPKSDVGGGEICFYSALTITARQR